MFHQKPMLGVAPLWRAQRALIGPESQAPGLQVTNAWLGEHICRDAIPGIVLRCGKTSAACRSKLKFGD